jgi:hypothetical protein
MLDFFEGLIDFALSATGLVSRPAESLESTGALNLSCRARRPAALIWSLLLVAGTGGVAKKAEAQGNPTTSHFVVREAFRHSSAAAGAPVDELEDLSVEGRLRTVQEQLSLNTKQLADAMRVGRPAVYGWLNGTTPREGQQARLKELYDIAREWKAANRAPVGKRLITPVGRGESLASLLRSEPLARARISEALTSIGKDLGRSSERRHVSQYKSAASVIQARNAKTPASEVRRQRLDELADF